MNVFVMIPFRDPFFQMYEKVIEPILVEEKKYKMQPVLLASRVGRAVGPGPIDEQIKNAIKRSHFCIADITGNNPNVMYEVAYAHALRKQVIFIKNPTDGVDVPFDIRHHRIIQYTTDENGDATLKEDLEKAIGAILDAEGSEIGLLKRALTPDDIDVNATRFVVAANPLSYRAAFRREGGWKSGPLSTGGDYVGIRGLIQSFSLIFGPENRSELLNPDDFDDRVFEEQQRVNLYTIGSSKANRWTEMLMDEFFENCFPKWDFKPDPESNEIMNPRVIVRKGGKKYIPEGVQDINTREWDFGLVIRGPHPKDSSCVFLIMAGRSALGTEATCLAVTAPDCLTILNEALNDAGVMLSDYGQAFCAVVSVRAENRMTDLSSFYVHEIIKY